MVISGTTTDINAALDGLTFTRQAGYAHTAHPSSSRPATLADLELLTRQLPQFESVSLETRREVLPSLRPLPRDAHRRAR